MSVKTIDTEIFINHLRDTLRNRDNKICFILGAGSSVESGIESGSMLAKQWYSELSNFHSKERINDWKAEVNFDENNIPAFYSKLFRLRYEGHRDDGIHFITSIIEKGSPGFGYTILSQVLQRTHHNVVITTNFDTLTEESLFVFTNKRALVCNHENVAHLARPSSARPLVVKIHRGLYMDPLNDQDEIDVMKPEWQRALTDIFRNYIPIVIGYGGNDGSLMNYLKNIDSCQRMYWCLTSDRKPSDDIVKVVERHRGSFVKTGGFNRLMFRFIDLFELTKMHDVLEQLAKERAEKLRKEFEEAGKDIGQTGTIEEKQELGKVAEDFDTTDWLQWQLKAAATNDPAEKKAVYLNALKTLPQSHQLYNNLGYWFDEWKQYDDAITAYRKAVEIKPDYHEAWSNIGISFKNIKKYDESIAAYRKAVEIKPDYYEAWYNMGISFHNTKEYDEAITAYRKVLEIKPDYHEAWLNMGNLLDDKEEYDEAITAYRKAVEIKPDKCEAWFNMGISFNNKKEYDEAITAYRKAVEIKPDYHQAWNNMGVSLNSKKEYDEAITAYSKAIEIEPGKDEIWYNMGISYKNKSDLLNARKCYEEAFRLNPFDPDYKKSLDDLEDVI